MHASDRLLNRIVVAVVGIVVLGWFWENREAIVGLVVIGSVLYTAVHLLTRFGEWYTGTHDSDARAASRHGPFRAERKVGSGRSEVGRRGGGAGTG